MGSFVARPLGRNSPRVVASEASPVPATLPKGAYLARPGGCLECHSADLHGNSVRNFSAPDISSGGIGAWSVAGSTTTMPTGRTPEGHMLEATMPWRAVGRLGDAELDALYHFLEAAPARSVSIRVLGR